MNPISAPEMNNQDNESSNVTANSENPGNNKFYPYLYYGIIQY